MKIHIVAVAGTGMGALAGLLAELGHEVSGSDTQFHPPMGPALRDWGVRCVEGFAPENLEFGPDLVVIGNVCRRDNPEARAAIDSGLQYTHIAGALGRFVLESTRPLVVAGTHGKTTTTSLAAWLLEANGLEPGFLIGGIAKNFARGFRAPPRRPRAPFVIEGDEYDTAFFEKTAKFHHYRASVAILTSLEHDHIDIYPTQESYEAAFRIFIETLPEDGLLVVNAADPTLTRLVGTAARCPVEYYALADAEHATPPNWHARPLGVGPGGTRFEIVDGSGRTFDALLPMVGSHNVGNALAAVVACSVGYGVDPAEAAQSLASFLGIKRRQELLGTPGGVFVYDDFAHHPTAVRETLAALRLRHPDGRLLVAFEPRSATACRSLHQQEYPKSFDDADEVLFAPLGRSGLPDAERLDLARVVQDLRERGRAAENAPSVDALAARLVERASAGDVIALLSNGAFGGIHARVLESLGPATTLETP